jgi:hypothetical protein
MRRASRLAARIRASKRERLGQLTGPPARHHWDSLINQRMVRHLGDWSRSPRGSSRFAFTSASLF